MVSRAVEANVATNTSINRESAVQIQQIIDAAKGGTLDANTMTLQLTQISAIVQNQRETQLHNTLSHGHTVYPTLLSTGQERAGSCGPRAAVACERVLSKMPRFPEGQSDPRERAPGSQRPWPYPAPGTRPAGGDPQRAGRR